MDHILEAIGFFIGRGMFYGSVCGLIAGSLIFPVFGSVLSIPRGAITGLILGVVIGVITGLLDLLAVRQNWELQRYRRVIVAATGIFIALAAPLFVYLSSEGVLWYLHPVTPDDWNASQFLPEVMIMTSLWAGLAAAFSAQRFKLRYDGLMSLDYEFFPESGGSVNFWIEYLFKWWQLHLITVVTVFFLGWMDIHYENFNLAEQFFRLIPISPILALISLTSWLFLGGSLGLLIVFINDVIFEEYLSHLSRAVHKNILTIIAVVFALLTGMIILLGQFMLLGVPAAIALGITARAYADWYWSEMQNNKHKRRTGDASDDFDLDDNPFETSVIS